MLSRRWTICSYGMSHDFLLQVYIQQILEGHALRAFIAPLPTPIPKTTTILSCVGVVFGLYRKFANSLSSSWVGITRIGVYFSLNRNYSVRQ